MSQDKSCEAIVLRRSDSSESDRYLVLLTPDFGKVDVVAKGARKAGSRLAGSSEPLIKAQFSWSEGRFRRFVTQVQPLTSYPGIRKDYDRLLAGLAIAEIVSHASEFESESQEVYGLLDQTLSELSSTRNPLHVSVWSLCRLLDIEGQFPDWTSCQVCSRQLDVSPAAVSSHAHGYLCRDHELAFNDLVYAQAETLIALKKINDLAHSPDKLKGADDCFNTVLRYFKGLLSRPLPACDAALRELMRP